MQEQELLRQVAAAKEDAQAADALISQYLPFIRAETARFLGRPADERSEDEQSIAMFAFYEAIHGYARTRGSFLKYAAASIRNRLIDYQRREARHRGTISLEAPAGASETPVGELLADPHTPAQTLAEREATGAEIRELTAQMAAFGVSLQDVTDNCPRQRRTLAACQRVLQYARTHPALLESFLRSKRLPITELCAGTGVERKTLERHRSYLVALLLVCTNGYEIIRGHLVQVLKGGA